MIKEKEQKQTIESGLTLKQKKRFRAIADAFQSAPGPAFISFKYKSATGELSQRLVCIHFKYSNSLKRDLDRLNEGLELIESDRYDKDDFNAAALELKTRIERQLKMSPEDYPAIKQRIVKITKSLFYDNENQELIIFGISVRKTSIGLKENIKKRKYTRNPIKIAKKNIIDNYLRTGKVRQFKLSGVVGGIKMNKKII